jgi:putative membrane protein
LGVLGVVSMLTHELILINRPIRNSTIAHLARIDGVYGMSSIIVVVTGLLMWLEVGKPPAFYERDGLIYYKLAIFSIVGLLSIYPTVYFVKNRKNVPLDEIVQLPRIFKSVVLLEVVLVYLIPVIAVVMAK